MAYVRLVLVFAVAFSVAVADGPARFDVGVDDIEALRWEKEHDQVHIRLDDDAASALKAATAGNVGRVLVVYVAGVEAVRATVMGVIDSGIITIRSPAPLLLTKLREIDAAPPRGKQLPSRGD